jgi:hypothetical protein
MLSFSLIVRYLLSACSSSPFTLLVSALPASKLAISQYDLEAPHFHSGVFETHPNHRQIEELHNHDGCMKHWGYISHE